MSWKNMTIGKRIKLGFGVILALLFMVGLLSFTGVSTIVRNAGQVIEGNKLDSLLAQHEVDHLRWVSMVNALLTDDSVATLTVEYDDHKCGFGKWLYGDGRVAAEKLVPELSPMLKAIETPHLHLHQSAIAINKLFVQADTKLPAMFRELEIAHLHWVTDIRDAILDGKRDLQVQTQSDRCDTGKWLNSEEARRLYQQGSKEFRYVWDQMLSSHDKLHTTAKTIQRYLRSGSLEEAKTYFYNNTKPLLDETVHYLSELHDKAERSLEGMQKANEIYARQTVPAMKQFQSILADIHGKALDSVLKDEVMLRSARSTQRNVTIIGIVALIIGVLFAFLIARGITSVLSLITHQLEEGAQQVASTSGQVSSASQALAEGASEQAASIEETSSALEEMSSMTSQNAENANQANNLMTEANLVVDRANHSMQGLTKSMDDIAKASEETSKIIKTIDEIAFQTNLLALNAAVEAARAGEAGAGFAVVADEVRNLAMRAADAAKSTAALIEDTVRKVKDGAAQVTNTNNEFSKVAGDVGKVGDLVREINAASNEQAQGIGQVNTAVNEMDKVTQQNAAGAEESASASEEMNAQALQLKEIVDHLMMLVGGQRTNGSSRKENNDESLDDEKPWQEDETVQKLVAVSESDKKEASNAGQKKKANWKYAENPDPRKVIPMDDDDFQDF